MKGNRGCLAGRRTRLLWKRDATIRGRSARCDGRLPEPVPIAKLRWLASQALPQVIISTVLRLQLHFSEAKKNPGLWLGAEKRTF